MTESMIYKKKWPAIFFVAPALIFLIIFLFYPFLQNIYNSFFNISHLGGELGAFNNFENYQRIFTDEKMHEALKNTLVMMICGIVFQVGIALLLAILVDSITKGANIYRTLYFFPIVISATAIGLMFYLIYMPEGALNQVLATFGIEPVYWLSETKAFNMMLIPILWSYVGFYFIIILTGLNNISEDIYEAASIDGVSYFQKIRYITLPLLHNVLVTSLTLSVTGSLKVFDLAWTLLPNGVQNTFFTGTYMYFVTFTKSDIDYGSTIAIVIVVLGVITAQVLNAVFKPKDY